MVHFCQRLNGECIPPHMFRIHILQIGDDRKAVQPLNTFRDQVNQRDRDRVGRSLLCCLQALMFDVDSAFSMSSVFTEEEGFSTRRISSSSFSPRHISQSKKILISVRGYPQR